MENGDKNIHDGHRKRLVDLALDAGIDSLSDIQVVELFLTYIFPRGDVNPLAHRLLQKYENFTQIVDADVCDLMRVKGINERSAKKIKLYGEMFFYYTTAKMGRKYTVSTKGDIIDIVEDFLRFRNVENLLLLAISPANIITHKRRLNMNNSTSVGIPVLELTSFLATSKASSIVVAHCHPYGRAFPSKEDIDNFKVIKDLCISCGVHLIDSYIVGEDGVYSQQENRMSREYIDIDKLKEVFSAE